MQITKFTDYALRVMLTLMRQPDRQRVQIKTMADALCISENHLVKVVHHLGKLGWIETYRGKNGGICLSGVALTLSIGSIIRQLETSIAPVNCFSPHCPLQGRCALEQALWQAQSAYLQVLDQVRLIEL
jgi:Rrf2 family nitric oxide-sensitive transcriptional repressor